MHPWVKLIGKAVYANTLPNDLLSSEISIERASDLFKQYVELVEIENHSYCNRTCWFCPNAFMDRRSVNHLMSDALFDKIIRDLQTIDYSQTLVWSRYHEPMADDSIYARVSEARRCLPNAYLVITSNGDYLNKKSLARLEASGLDRLLLDLYLPDHKEHELAELELSLAKFRKRTELVVEERAEREYVISGSPIKITMGAPIYTKENMSTRGGLMELPKSKTYTRRAACFAPIHHVVIDYNGQGMLCCQARSDAAQHADSVIMDLNKLENTLFHFYRALGPARAGLIAPGLKCGICVTCDRSDDGPDKLARNRTVAAILRASGLSKGVQAAKVRGGKRRYEEKAAAPKTRP
jgi:radical SAM family protein